MNALLFFIEKVLVEGEGIPPGPLFASIGVDGGLGFFLLAGHDRVRKWAIVRVAIGALVWPLIAYFSLNSIFLVMLQLTFSASMLALLVGRAGHLRIGVALVATLMVFSATVSGILGAVGGSNPIAVLVMRVDGAITGDTIDELNGRVLPYRLNFDGTSGWYLSPDSFVKAQNPLVDSMAIRPESDTSIMVLVEALPPDQRIEIDAYADLIYEMVDSSLEEVELIAREDLYHSCPAVQLRYSANVDGIHLQFVNAMYTCGNAAYQVIGFADEKRMAENLQELHAIVATFEPPEL